MDNENLQELETIDDSQPYAMLDDDEGDFIESAQSDEEEFDPDDDEAEEEAQDDEEE